VANGGGYTVVVTDVVGQSLTSSTAVFTVGIAGSGTGVTGDYYSNQTNFAGPPVLTRIDPTVNFNFGTGSPDPSISVDNFAIRWSGQVQPFYSQTYTFYVTTDDGVRLWVNGQRLVDNWKAQGPTEKSGAIALTAGQKYDILMEYFEKSSGAVATLSWSSQNQGKQIVPQTQLYPTPSNGTTQPSVTALLTGNGTNVIFNWSGSYVLQTSTNVVGPYEDLTNSTSPYTNSLLSDPQRFFRLISE
jgi:hypothetical protein